MRQSCSEVDIFSTHKVAIVKQLTPPACAAHLVIGCARAILLTLIAGETAP